MFHSTTDVYATKRETVHFTKDLVTDLDRLNPNLSPKPFTVY